MYTQVALRKPACCTQLILHNTRVFPENTTIYISTHVSYASIFTATHVCPLNTRLLSLKPACFSYRCQKKKFLEVLVVWVVMQLTLLVATNFSSTLSLQKNINRGREVHERTLESLHRYVRGIGTLFSHTFSLVVIPLCCRAWRLSSLEKRSNRTRSRFREVPNLKRRYICTSFLD